MRAIESKQHNVETASQSRWKWGAVITFIAVLQFAISYRDSRFGRLAALVPWDDNAILDDGLHRLSIMLHSSSFLDLLRHFQELAPHAPIADLQAALGLMIFNSWIVGPYLLNALWILLVVAALAKGLQVSDRVLAILVIVVVGAALSLGVFSHLLADYKAAIFLAAGLLLLSEPSPSENARPRIAGCVLLSLAVLCKLTAFYLPVMICLILVGLEIPNYVAANAPAKKADLFAMARPKPILGYLADRRSRIILEAGIVLVPYMVAFAWGGRNLLAYIWHALSPTWADGLTYIQRAAFYLPGGGPLWGPLPWLFLVAFISSIVTCWLGKRWVVLISLFCGLLISVICFIPIVVAKTSDAPFGSYFIGAVLGTTLIAIRYLAAHSVLGFRTMAAAAALFLVVTTPGEGPSGREGALRQARESYEKIVDQIVALETRATPSVKLVFEDGAAGYDNLSLIHFAKTGQVLNPGRIDDFSDAAKFSRQLQATDFVITLTPISPDVSPGYMIETRFPSSRDLAGGDRMVSSEPSMRKVMSFPWANGRLHLYRNLSLTRASD